MADGRKARAAAAAASIAYDALALAGACGIAYGAWLIYAPAGFIVGGIFAVAAGVAGAVHHGAG